MSIGFKCQGREGHSRLIWTGPGVYQGEINASQIGLDSEFRIGVLERVLEWVVNNNPEVRGPEQETVTEIRADVLTVLQEKYPNSDISLDG